MIAKISQPYYPDTQSLRENKKYYPEQRNTPSSHLPFLKRIGRVKKLESYSLHVSKPDQDEQRRSYNQRNFPSRSGKLEFDSTTKRDVKEKIKRLGKNKPCSSFVYKLSETNKSIVIGDQSDENGKKLTSEIREQIQVEIETVQKIATVKTIIKEEISEDPSRQNIREERKLTTTKEVEEFKQQNGQIFSIVIRKAPNYNKETKKNNSKREEKRYSQNVKLLTKNLKLDSRTSSNDSEESKKSKSSKKSNFLSTQKLSLNCVGIEALKNAVSSVKLSPTSKKTDVKKKYDQRISQKPHIVFKSHPYLDRKVNTQKKPSLLASKQTLNQSKNFLKSPNGSKNIKKRESNISNISIMHKKSFIATQAA